MRPLECLLVLLACPALALAAPTRVAMMPIAAGEGVTEKLAASLTEAAAAELRRSPDVQLLTQQELATLLTHKQQKQLIGCGDAECAANLAGALGADLLVVGNVARLGESWLLNLKLIDVKKATTAKQVDRRLRGKTVDDLLDELPSMAGELLGARLPSPVREAAKSVSSAPAVASGAADVPAEVTAIRAGLKLLSDGAGRFVAFDPKAGSFDPFYAGDATALYAQRVSGGGRNGDDFDKVFWDPRAKSRWQAGFGFKEGKYSLQCGDRVVALSVVQHAEAKKLLDAAKFYTPRWKRRGFAIARDDTGIFYFVDQAREPDDNTDFRLFVGRKGKLAPVALEDSNVDEGGLLFVSSGGALRIVPAKREAEWIEGRNRIPLVYLDLEDQATFAYTTLGVYRGEKLGTACDERF